MKLRVTLLLLCWVFAHSASALSQGDCRAVQWPYSRAQTNEEYAKIFFKTDKTVLLQYYYWELTHAEQKSIEDKLAVYLINTEQNEDMKGFLDLLDYAAHRTVKGEPGNRVLDMNEICSLYERGRLPATVHKKTGKRKPSVTIAH